MRDAELAALSAAILGSNPDRYDLCVCVWADDDMPGAFVVWQRQLASLVSSRFDFNVGFIVDAHEMSSSPTPLASFFPLSLSLCISLSEPKRMRKYFKWILIAVLR